MGDQFIYSKFVTGKNFIGRGVDVKSFVDLIARGENVVIYEPPKTGKRSLVEQGFSVLQSTGTDFTVVRVNMLNVRSILELMKRIGTGVLNAIVRSHEEYPDAVARHLGGTHFMFDLKQWKFDGSILSLSWDLDDTDIRAILSLPYRAAAEKGTRFVLLLEEFQSVMLTEDGEKVCKILEEVFANTDPALRQRVSYVFLGSRVNAMHEIFGIRKFFFRQVERVKIGEIDTKEIVEHVTRGFSSGGKVMERDLLIGVCNLFKGNIFYINQFAAICDSLSRGYIMEPALRTALDSLVAVNEPRFLDIMNDLTTFQVNLLKAVLDGHTKFTSTEVIAQYGLNSSANVKRLRDALGKKEIVFFDQDGYPTILDPLFEYWARKVYFEMKDQQ